jgi:hypothetical protein
MDLADLFQQSERLWAENERVRLRLNETLRQAQRSFSQQAGPQDAAPRVETSDPRSDDAGLHDATSNPNSDH